MSGTRASLFLAFDFGSQFIGVAAGSSSGGVPTPLSAVRVFRAGPDWAAISRLVREWNPAGFVVGVALSSRGRDTFVSRRARRFGRQLEERYHRPVHWVDETLTTEAARQALHGSEPSGRSPRKADIDATAAALILESFLGAGR